MTAYPIQIRPVTLQLGNSLNTSKRNSICVGKGVYRRNDNPVRQIHFQDGLSNWS